MKNVFKTIVFAAAFCLFAACQQELIPQEKETPAGELTITASRASLTKVEYAEDGGTHNLVGSWEVGDVIFGFTGAGATVSFSVASVDGVTGVATLSQTTSVELANGDVVHVIHCPGKTASDLEGQTLAVDFSSQAANVIPVLLLSTATVAGDKLAFNFTNAVSILGVKNPTFPVATTASKLLNITVSGHEIVSSGVVSLSGGNLIFTGNAPDKFITKTVNATPVVVGETFTIDDPVYIVIPAGPVTKVSAVDNMNHYFEYAVNQTATVSKFYCINDKTFTQVTLPTSSGVPAGGVNWAKWNLGATSVTNQTSWGNLYRWSDYRCISSRDGSTVNMDGGHAFGYTTYDDEIYYTGSGYSKYTASDGKTVLDPVDDIVQLTYPGSGWRMPTLAEYTDLDALEKDLDPGSNKGVKYYYPSKAAEEETVFFPSNVPVCNKGTTFNKYGRYWTSTLYTDPSNSNHHKIAYFFETVYKSGSTSSTSLTGAQYRYLGFVVRPVRPI